jgi:L-lactate dehydrogenase complex protein LldG
VEVVPFEGPDPDADLGVVGGAWGIAATGTVVLDAARAGGRSASLLPPAVCVLLPAERILPEAGALFRDLERGFPRGLPSQLVLSTGPSKTGDIEQQLITGVHGPGRVWIGLLGAV